MNNIYFFSLFVAVLKVVFADYESKIEKYFESEITRTIRKYFQNERLPLENAIARILQENYGDASMNVFVKRQMDRYKISNGFYFSDNIVDVVLQEMYLRELPSMIAPEVNFALAFNNLHIEAGLGQITINTRYTRLRNKTAALEQSLQQDPYKTSPFSFEQVQDAGELTIIANDCTLVGYTITTLGGDTVNLGHDTFKVTNCSFSVEIYSMGYNSPPVLGPYFSKEQSITLERIITKPIRAELMPKLQGAVFSYVNTSAIFRDKLKKLQSHQKKFFKETTNYMSSTIGKFVKEIIKKTQGLLQLESIEILWDQTGENFVQLKNMVLYGLDTAYISHAGGPYKMKSIGIAESIRFSTMQVRGKIFFENITGNTEHDFAVELKDVAVNVEMEAKDAKLDRTKLDFVGWRVMEYSIIELHTRAYERKASQSFITGYLINEIPKQLLKQISEILGVTSDKSNVQHRDSKELSEESDGDKIAKEEILNTHNIDIKQSSDETDGSKGHEEEESNLQKIDIKKSSEEFDEVENQNEKSDKVREQTSSDLSDIDRNGGGKKLSEQRLTHTEKSTVMPITAVFTLSEIYKKSNIIK